VAFGDYGDDVLATNWRAPRVAAPVVDAVRDLVVEDAGSEFCGAIVRVDSTHVELDDGRGRRRVFPLGGGFLIDGTSVHLRYPAVAPGEKAAQRTASGSFAVADQRARVARASRIFVEGRHDAELVERVWGDDLRVEGVVVEYLEGVDALDSIIRDFGPGPGRRVGVLVDHLVPGSKESRIADAVARGSYGKSVLVVGHPFVDVWQSVKPSRLGIDRWPVIARGTEWKHGVCAAFGWPHADQADIAAAWRRILGTVRSYADLEPVLLARVEELIDFVTAD